MADQETPAAVVKTMALSMTRRRAQELGLLACECGHPENNHFDFDARPCAHCSCRGLSEVGIRGVTIIAQATLDACEQAAPRVRAEERERVALAFDAESEAPEMRAHAKCLRASAAFVRALGEKL